MSGFRVQGSGFRVQGSGFGFGVLGSGSSGFTATIPLPGLGHAVKILQQASGCSDCTICEPHHLCVFRRRKVTFLESFVQMILRFLQLAARDPQESRKLRRPEPAEALGDIARCGGSAPPDLTAIIAIVARKLPDNEILISLGDHAKGVSTSHAAGGFRVQGSRFRVLGSGNLEPEP